MRPEAASVEQYLDQFPELESDPAGKLELIKAELEMCRASSPGCRSTNSSPASTDMMRS